MEAGRNEEGSSIICREGVNSIAIPASSFETIKRSLSTDSGIVSVSRTSCARMVMSGMRPNIPSYRPAATFNNGAIDTDGGMKREELRRQAKQAEFELDMQLSSYSRLNLVTPTGAIAPLSQAERKQLANNMSNDIQGKLEGLLRLVEQMEALGDTGSPSAVSWRQQVQRHRDLYHDYTREYQRVRASLEQSANRNAVHPLAHNEADIEDSVSESLLEEKTRLDSSHRRTDQVIEMAFAARESLHTQSMTLMGSSRKAGLVSGGLERTRALISKIQLRKRRDKYIMAIVVLVCFILLFLYWAHRHGV